jgi:hypothetical protein
MSLLLYAIGVLFEKYIEMMEQVNYDSVAYIG